MHLQEDNCYHRLALNANESAKSAQPANGGGDLHPSALIICNMRDYQELCDLVLQRHHTVLDRVDGALVELPQRVHD